MRRITCIGALMAFLVTVSSPVSAVDGCPELSTGRVVPPSGMTSIEIQAPVGSLIDEVCLIIEGGAGPITHGVDPLSASLVVDGGGLPIAEYSASFVALPAGAEMPEEEEVVVNAPPALATIPEEDVMLPDAVAAGDGSSATAYRFGPWALLGMALIALGGAIIEFTWFRGRRSS